MSSLANQLKQVFRRLVRAPLFTAITLITLSVGIGANAVVFGVVYGVLLKPLSYPNPEQLIGIWHNAAGLGFDNLNMAPFLYFIDREQSKTLQDVGMYNGDSTTITAIGKPEHINGLDVRDGVLPMPSFSPTATGSANSAQTIRS